MASRQDHATPYRPGRERLVSALVAHDADPERIPLRGAGVATLAGLLVTAIVVGAVGVWARLGGGGDDDWRDPHALIIEAGTGARYVWRDPLLHPVLNYTSAVLVLGDPAPATVTVPRAALDGVPRGPVLGIPGAPESLPPADDLVTGAWSVCAPTTDPAPAAPRTGATSTDAAPPTVHVGVTPSGGTLLDTTGLLAAGGDGAVHLLWRGYRYRVPATGAPAAGGTPSVRLPDGLLAVLPAGGERDRDDLPPLARPRPEAVVCAVVRDGAEAPDVILDATPPPAAAYPRPEAATGAVRVEPGRAALVTSGTSVQLVTDLGVRHAVTPEALELLGYGAVRPVRLPAEVLALVPEGPVLDPVDARGQATDARPGPG